MGEERCLQPADTEGSLMRIIHIVTNRVFPTPGGLEQSVITIADMLSELPGTSVFIYTRDAQHGNVYPPETIGRHPITHLAVNTRAMREPFKGSGLPHEERYRFDCLALRNAIEDALRKYPMQQHMIISFFASTTGFIAQKIAEDLGIPHVASIRGSDYAVGAYSANFGYALEYVCRRAAAVVTTNDSQTQGIRRMFDRGAQLRTIYNSVSYNPKPKSAPAEPIIFSDTGLSFKKGTQILLRAFQKIASEFPLARLVIAGDSDVQHQDYWADLLQDISRSLDGRVEYLGHLPAQGVADCLDKAAVYASATLAEGCSNGRLLGIASLIPVATTRTGEICDRGDLPHVFTCKPGDEDAFAGVLLQALIYHQSGAVCEQELVRDWLEPMHPRFVRNAWENVINSVIPKYDNVIRASQPRLLFFSHDGSGVGHLRRLSRIAGALQGPCACLVVTGHPTAGWIVPESCEFIHLPSLDSLIVSRSRYWGRDPFLRLPFEDAKAFRNTLLSQVIRWYQPDALFVDFLPLGKNHELADAILNLKCKKYFILRGVLDDPRNVRINVLGGNGEQALENQYDRVFVTSDARVIDVGEEYSLSKSIRQKLCYTGYVAQESSAASRAATRVRRGVPAGAPWVVCSAGGGKLGERLIQECLRIAATNRHLFFDVVLGPRSAMRGELATWPNSDGRVRVLQESPDLPDLHAAADIVVCPGGYNSMVEALAGESELICVPVQPDGGDEQFIHAQRLAVLYRLQMVTAPHKIEAAIDRAVAWIGTSPITHSGVPLNLVGATTIRNQVLDDFGIV